MFPVLECALPSASRTEVISEPLLTMISWKAEAAVPLIVLSVAPLKVTEPVPALNMLLLVQSPYMLRL